MIHHFACENNLVVGTSTFNKWIVFKCLQERSDMFVLFVRRIYENEKKCIE